MADINVQDLIRQEATKAGIPNSLALAVAEQESGFNPTLINQTPVNGEHATGTFQLLPSTANMLKVDPNDPVQNIRGGVTYLRQLMDKHQGNLNKVLAEYGGVRTNTTYVPQVLARRDKYAAEDATPAATPDAAAAPAAVGMPPPAPEPGFWDRVRGTFNLTTNEGRRNFGGALGGIAGGTLASPTFAFSGPVGPATGALVGAGTGGMIAEGVNRFIGPPPPPDSSLAGDVGRAGTGQMFNEAIGQSVMGVLRPVGKALIATPVARAAIEQMQSAFEAVEAALGRARTPIQPSVAGREFDQMVQGPARSSLNALGEAVDQAAETGPMLPTQPLKDRLAELSAQVTPLASHAQPPAGALPAGTPAAAAPAAPGAALAPTGANALTAPLPADHPLPAVLAKVEQVLNDAGDEISFSDAHKVKRAVDDALDWASPAKKQAQQLGKGFRQTLRNLMSSHQPYNDATDAYAQTIKLFNRGVSPQLHRGIIDNPEAIVTLIKSNQPTRLQFLKDLVDHASQSAPQQAQQAWDAVRGAWTNKNLIAGDVAKLGDRLAKMDPDFERLMFSGPNGQSQLANLKTIAASYQTALANQTAYAESSLGRVRSIGETMRDVGHITLPTHPHTKMIAAGRLLLFGPKSSDLIKWAADSPFYTRLLVHALTEAAPGTALANLMKVYEHDTGDTATAEQAPGSSVAVGTAPPTPPGAQVGQPPPALR